MGTINNGRDLVARAVGGDTVGFVGTATSVTGSTVITDSGAAFPVSSGGPPAQGGLVGHAVIAGSAAANLTYGVIISNTATALTVDQWHSPTAPETVATTPSGTAPYIITPGGLPAFYMGITINATAFSATDTTLATGGGAEEWTASAGLRRRLATWAHTTGTATYTIANTFTANGSDTGLPKAIAKIGIFQHFVNTTVTASNSGQMLFETVLSATATIAASGDNVTITDTVTIT